MGTYTERMIGEGEHGYWCSEDHNHMLTFAKYQLESRSTAIYPSMGCGLWYPVLGLTGEAGEVAEKVKKIFRDRGGVITQEDKEALGKELGDVLWYLAQIATDLGISLEEVGQNNIEKLQSRKKRDVLQGDGDNR